MGVFARKSEKNRLLGLLVAGLLLASGTAHAVNWTNVAGGSTDWDWNDNGNWDGVFPNAAGAVADINLDVDSDDMDIVLGQDITIGSLAIGDTTADPATGQSIWLKNSTYKLTFESASPGGSTTVTLTNVVDMDPSYNESVGFICDVLLGGTSPLTVTAHDHIEFNGIDFNGNTMTVEGPDTGSITLDDELTGSSASRLIHNGDFTVTFNETNSAFNGTMTLNGTKARCVYGGIVGTNAVEIAEGCTVEIGSNSGFNSNPGQRLTTNTLTMSGGILDHVSQRLTGSATGEVVRETIELIDLDEGGSRIQLSVRDGAAGMVLDVGAFTRERGAVLTVAADDLLGGDTNMTDTGQQLNLSSLTGMVGGGGAEGTTTMSIFPWIVSISGHYSWSGKELTTHGTNGLRELRTAEYETDLSSASSAENVNPSSLTLAADKTVNAMQLYYDYNDLGAGRTLTIASGALIMKSGKDRIGNIGSAAAGTLSFGTAEGIIYSTATHNTGTNTIGAVISGTGGLTKAGSGELLLAGNNSYSGTTTVTEGILQVGDGTTTTAGCNLGNDDVVICDGATLHIMANVTDAMNDAATLTLRHAGLQYGKVDLESGINEEIAVLVLGGTTQSAGTYGSTSSSADNTDDNYFSGVGIITALPNGSAFLFR